MFGRKKRLIFDFIILFFFVSSFCLMGSGCSNKDSGDKNIGDIVNEINEFVDFTEKQKINTDKQNYSNLERIVGLMIFENELAYNKSFRKKVK